MPSSLPPIPTPLAQRWRDFCIQVLPVMTFFCVVAVVWILWQNYLIPTQVVEVVTTNTTVVARRQRDETMKTPAPALVPEQAQKAGMPGPPLGRNE